ncbi:MAG TPA: hypothetical protein EYP14_09005 [Planctomycetaceae bacterium]|nr:hypothetical protein [Planctomycetaceae bacterium]
MPPVVVSNPLFVPCPDQETVWERTVDVLHAYHFPVVRENRLEGVIETGYKVGSGVLEPWHYDSVGLEERVESSLQSIRRRVVINVAPADGGFLIGVEALKELEDAPGAMPNAPGAATFSENAPLRRNLGRVVERPDRHSEWIALGRDFRLEQSLLAAIQRSFGQ